MRALSLHQPWASIIIEGHKNLENRPRRTSIRGWVLVHASKTFDSNVFAFLQNESGLTDVMATRFGRAQALARKSDLNQGGIIGAMRIDDCISSSGNPWFMGPHAYVIGAVKPLPFYPCRGMQGFFNVDLPAEIASQVPGISYTIDWKAPKP